MLDNQVFKFGHIVGEAYSVLHPVAPQLNKPDAI